MALKQERGFSLVELMLVAALAAVMMGMAVPSVAAAIRQYTVMNATQQVASALRAARVQAVGRNQTLHIHFNEKAGTYQLLDDDNARVGGELTLPAGMRFIDVSNDVEFGPDGRVDPAVAPVTIVVGNETDDRIISVTTSGRVVVP